MMFRRKKLIRQMSFCEEDEDCVDPVDQEIVETVRRASMSYTDPDHSITTHDTCNTGTFVYNLKIEHLENPCERFISE